MLGPLTAVSLASSVVQLVDFSIKVVTGSIELYHSANGSNTERSDLEAKTARICNLAERVDVPPEPSNYVSSGPTDSRELGELAKTCKSVASDLIAVLGDLKVKRPAGPGRKWESFQKAVAALTPWNKDKIASLDKRLSRLQQDIFSQILIMLR